MKLDFDLIRQILLDVENLPAGQSLKEFKYPGYGSQTVDAHIEQMKNENLIEVHTVELFGGHVQHEIKSLTFKGDEFIKAAKDDSIWNKFIKPGASFSLTVLFELLKAEVKKRLGLP